MNKIIVLHGKKGGMGKTTLMLNIAVELAKRGKKTLIIDADGQGSTTGLIKKDLEDFEVHSWKWFALGGKTKGEVEQYARNVLKSTIKPSKIEGIDLVNGGLELYEFAQDLTTKVGKEKYLGRNLTVAKEVIDYDYILIDLNPAFDVLAINSYLAADSIVQIVDRSEMGLSSLQETVLDWQIKAELLGANNLVEGLIINRINGSKMSKEVLKAIYTDEEFQKLAFKTFIPENASFEKSVVTGGIWPSYIKRLDNWKPTKGMTEWLEENEIPFSEGNPIVNLVNEMFQREII